MKNYDTSLDASNPAARVPVVLLLDNSSSMRGAPIAELNAGCNRFFREVRSDDAAALSTEVALVTFNTAAQVVHGFASAFDYPAEPGNFTAGGQTATGEALELAERLLAEREALYRKLGVPHFKGWVVCLTDGCPYPDRGWRAPAERFRTRAAKGDLTYLCVGVGDGINVQTLAELSADEPGVVRLQELKFGDFFKWLSDSVHDISVSGVGNQDDVRLRGMSGWARFAKGGAQ